MTILELIKKACKSKGVPEDYAERIQKTFKVEKAEGLETYVDLFKENILPAIKEAENNAKKEAKQSAVSEYEKKHNIKDGKPVEKQPEGGIPPIDTSTLSPEVKAIIENQNNQIQQLTNLVKSTMVTVTNIPKLETAKGLLKEAELPEKWLNRLDLESETSMEDQVNALKEEYTELKQSIIDQSVASGAYAPGGNPTLDLSVEEWGKLMDQDNSQTGNTGVVDLGL